MNRLSICWGPALACCGLMACHLDTSNKLSCDTPSDCLSGYECREHRCMRLGEGPSTEPLPAPSDLSGTRDSELYLLTWRDNAVDESGYLVERRVGAAGLFEDWDTTPANETEYQVQFDPSDQQDTYSFRVRAARWLGGELVRSEPSDAVATVIAAPDPPSFEYSVVDTIVNLSWDPVDFKYETEECGYNVYVAFCGSPEDLSDPWRTAACDATDASLDLLVPDDPDDQLKWRVSLVAFNRWGQSPPVTKCLE